MTAQSAGAESLSQAVLLPSMQLGRPVGENPDGNLVYMTIGGKLVCRHGECSSTICYWLSLEKKAREAGLPSPPRGGSRGRSLCDCQTTEGLNTKITDVSALPPPHPPTSLYELLEEMGTERVLIKGREARRIPHLPGPTFVTTAGRLCCRHGASRFSLRKKQKSTKPSLRLPTCGCELMPFPVRRAGLKGLQLGKWANKKGLVSDHSILQS